MNRRVGARIVWFSLALVVLASCSRAQQKASSYDGHWWLSISENEQSGFLNGYFDCYYYEFKGPARFSYPVDLYQLEITKFFRMDESNLSTPVSEVLLDYRDSRGFKIIDKYAEHAKGPHGYYDGLYWRQISEYTGPELEQLGFVEGYLACHAGLNHNKGGVFSKPPAEYVRLITQWYGFNRKTDDVDAKREPAAIAEALFKFRDQPQDSPPGNK